MRRARAMLLAQRPGIHGGVVAHLPDFLIWADPRAAVRARRMPGDPMKLQELVLDRK